MYIHISIFIICIIISALISSIVSIRIQSKKINEIGHIIITEYDDSKEDDIYMVFDDACEPEDIKNNKYVTFNVKKTQGE